jgi:hypothetical protein
LDVREDKNALADSLVIHPLSCLITIVTKLPHNNMLHLLSPYC